MKYMEHLTDDQLLYIARIAIGKPLPGREHIDITRHPNTIYVRVHKTKSFLGVKYTARTKIFMIDYLLDVYAWYYGRSKSNCHQQYMVQYHLRNWGFMPRSGNGNSVSYLLETFYL